LRKKETTRNEEEKSHGSSELEGPEHITVNNLEEAIVWNQLDVGQHGGLLVHLLVNLEWEERKKRIKSGMEFPGEAGNGKTNESRVVDEHGASAHDGASAHEGGVRVTSRSISRNTEKCGVRVISLAAHEGGVRVVAGRSVATGGRAHEGGVGVVAGGLVAGRSPHEGGIRVVAGRIPLLLLLLLLLLWLGSTHEGGIGIIAGGIPLLLL